MRSLERGRSYEGLNTAIGRIAYAYGFSAAPAALPRKALAASGNVDTKTAATLALLNAKDTVAPGVQNWGSAKTSKGTVIAFSIGAGKQPIAHALVVKTALSIAEEAGFTELSVLISSIGDAESRRRFTRELGNFFRKNTEALDTETRHLAAKDPDAAYRVLLANNDPLLARAPRSIDYLSENSRKNMLSALSLFESVGIPYVMHPRLAGEPNVHSEILFAIEGTGKDGERARIAFGGRFDADQKRERGKNGSAISISVEVPERIDCEAAEEAPACFVVHVGDAAKLKSFSILEALWRANVGVGQALLAENLRDQMLAGTNSKARYLAIIGQREALDNTVIVRNAGTQMQTVLPAEKLEGYVSRGHRN